jgi:hypothetical protein
MPRAVYDRMIERGVLGEDDPIERARRQRDPRPYPGLAAAIADDWIVDLGSRVLQFYREPREMARDRYDHRDAVILGIDQIVTPLAAPDARIAIRDLLP